MNDSTLLTIKEFSNFTGVTQSTLRYYDEIGLLPPAARGENNYRYYIPFQLITLNFINVLVDLGIPLSTIKDMNKNRTPKSVIELLSQQEVKLDRQLYDLRTAYSIIHTFRNNIQNGLLAQGDDICLQEFGETNLVLGPVNDFKGHDTFYEAFINFCNSANDYRINLRYPIGGYHDNIDAFFDKPNRPTRFFSLDPIGNTKRKAGQYLVGYKHGYYGEFEDLPERMAAYAEEHNLSFYGPAYSIYLLDEISIVEPDQYLSSLAIAVSSKKEKKAASPRK